ncbi:MAG: Hint domain-containing protein [Pseudomonadota bacterium]
MDKEELQNQIQRGITTTPQLVGSIEAFDAFIRSEARSAGFVAVGAGNVGYELDLEYFKGSFSLNSDFEPDFAFSFQRPDSPSEVAFIYNSDDGFSVAEETDVVEAGAGPVSGSITIRESVTTDNFEVSFQVGIGTKIRVKDGFEIPVGSEFTGGVTYQFIRVEEFVKGTLYNDLKDAYEFLGIDLTSADFEKEHSIASEAFLTTSEFNRKFQLEAFVAVRNYVLSGGENAETPAITSKGYARTVTELDGGGYTVTSNTTNPTSSRTEVLRVDENGGLLGWVIYTYGPDSSGNFRLTSLSRDGETIILPSDDQKRGELLSEQLDELNELDPKCFLAGTPVSMFDGSVKPIEEIVSGDLVLSYDKDGELVPGRVTRTFQNRSKHILDLFGLMTTPGHVTYCADGKFAGRHVPVIDILRSDGALMREDGTKVRAATGCELGTDGDDLIWAIAGDKNTDGTANAKERGLIRAGTRFILENGKDFSVLELIEAAGGMITEDGFIQTSEEGEKMPFHWRFTESLPKPEDYVLQRSQISLAEIYGADEWEAVPPQMPRPASPSRPTVIAPNIPLSMVGADDQPAMTTVERRAFEEKHTQKAHSTNLQ